MAEKGIFRMIDPVRLETLRRLTSEIRGLERGAGDTRPRTVIPSGYPALNAILPGGGLPGASLVEILSEPGMGAMTLALKLARKAIESKPAWAVVDSEAVFYPPAAAQLGFDVNRLILIRPPPQKAAWALNQLLRCPDVGASFFASSSMDNMTWRRLQLAAERGGNVGFVLRPVAALRKPCWASLRLMLAASNGKPSPSVEIQIVHVRGGSVVAGTLSSDW
jgi:hypothetical protein